MKKKKQQEENFQNLVDQEESLSYISDYNKIEVITIIILIKIIKIYSEIENGVGECYGRQFQIY